MTRSNSLKRLAALALWAVPAFAQPPHGTPGFWKQAPWSSHVQSLDFSVDRMLSVGEKAEVHLNGRYFVHEVVVQAVSADNASTSFHVFVNGIGRGPFNVPPRDPYYTVPISAETDRIAIVAAGVPGHHQGRLQVMSLKVRASGTELQKPAPHWPTPKGCGGCDELDFPIYFKTVMGNLSNRAIVLVDRLSGYTDYASYGKYLLPIKIAAAESRTAAEVNGDAHSSARVYYEELLDRLDCAQPYLRNMYERNHAFDWATELLSLREKIRRTIGPKSQK